MESPPGVHTRSNTAREDSVWAVQRREGFRLMADTVLGEASRASGMVRDGVPVSSRAAVPAVWREGEIRGRL